MLVRLLPEQIACRWSMIKQAIIRSVPPYVDVSLGAMNNVLMSFLNGTLQCWIWIEEGKVKAIFSTCIEEDTHSRTKNLLIYSLYGLERLTGRFWVGAFEGLKRYALGEGCGAVIAITKEEKIARVVERLGGDASWRYLRISLTNPMI